MEMALLFYDIFFNSTSSRAPFFRGPLESGSGFQTGFLVATKLEIGARGYFISYFILF